MVLGTDKLDEDFPIIKLPKLCGNVFEGSNFFLGAKVLLSSIVDGIKIE